MKMYEFVSPRAFKLINQLDAGGLLQISTSEVRPLLPTLVRMSLCSSLDSSVQWEEKRKFLLQLLSGMSAVNEIIALLSVDFRDLAEDARKEQQMKSKLTNGTNTESILLSGLKQQGLLLEFERSEPARRFRIVISELLPVVMKLDSDDYLNNLNFPIDSELFTSEAYLQDVTDVLCIACAELPNLLPLSIVSEALLYFTNGVKVLIKLVANNSESLLSICHSLLQAQSKHAQSNNNKAANDKLRCEALMALCTIHPECAFTLRNLCVQACQLPELAVSLTLDHIAKNSEKNQTSEKSVIDIVAFVSGLLLGSDSKVRNWFATYLRNTKDELDNKLRKELIKELNSVVKSAEVSRDSGTGNGMESMHILQNENCMRASALIRLYCSLKAIASMKFTSEESDLLLRLITCYPPLTPCGIRFVSLALGMLLACPSLLVLEEQEKQVISWVKWLASRSSELENVGPEGCSFAEQLLLTAIHLHGERHSAAVHLACSTLGMRIKVSSSALSKLRHIFTEEVFPTQVVAAHAMKIPVTKRLSSSMTGYLPVHCIYQLLKTRAFSQGRVPVKEWIYKQICAADSPLHPQLQPLILQYVTTIVTPATKGSAGSLDGHLNEPFEESQILKIFGVTGKSEKSSNTDYKSGYSLTAQLLMLYYVLLYEDSILNNMKSLALLSNRPHGYSSRLIDQIPVKLLVHRAQKHPKACQGLYPALLGLLTTHLPHLCLVEDWLQDLDTVFSNPSYHSALTSLPTRQKSEIIDITPNQLFDGLRQSVVNPAPALMHLRTLSHPNLPADDVIGFATALTRGLPFVLNEKVSRRVRQEAQKLWFKLNSVIPRKLWIMTVNALQPPLASLTNRTLDTATFPSSIAFSDLLEDPLIPLTADKRVLRCPELLAIILRILSACLSASRSQAAVLLRANPSLDSRPTVRSVSPLGNPPVTDNEKEELKVALTSAQSSAAVQLLIEICLLEHNNLINDVSKRVPQEENLLNILTYKREVQCLVCSTLHQMFIEDPNVAKLVHFQVRNNRYCSNWKILHKLILDIKFGRVYCINSISCNSD